VPLLALTLASALTAPNAMVAGPALAGQRDPALEQRLGRSPLGEPPALFREELQLPDTLGVGRVGADVARQFPAVEALTDYLTERAAEVRYARALPVLAREREEIVGFLKSGIADLVSAEPLDAMHDVQESGGTVLLAERRGDRAVYRAVVFVREDSPARSLADLDGDCFAFGRGDSGTSYLVPLAALRERGLSLSRMGGPAGEPPAGHGGFFVLEKDTSVPLAVTRRVAAAGAVTNEEWEREQSLGNTTGLRIVHTGPDLPRALVVAGPGMSADRRDAVRRTLLAMQDDPAGRAALAAYGNVTDFAPIDEGLRQDIEHVRRLYEQVRDEVH
jgi:phosphonate transport system substrate-binding protein